MRKTAYRGRHIKAWLKVATALLSVAVFWVDKDGKVIEGG